LQAKPAWVIVAPPDFAPGIHDLVTLRDIVYEVAVARGWLAVPDHPSFTKHIQPILNRAQGYQWVGHPSLAGLIPSNLEQLANPAYPGTIRSQIQNNLENPKNL